jgi:hypothetical protein
MSTCRYIQIYICTYTFLPISLWPMFTYFVDCRWFSQIVNKLAAIFEVPKGSKYIYWLKKDITVIMCGKLNGNHKYHIVRQTRVDPLQFTRLRKRWSSLAAASHLLGSPGNGHWNPPTSNAANAGRTSISNSLDTQHATGQMCIPMPAEVDASCNILGHHFWLFTSVGSTMLLMLAHLIPVVRFPLPSSQASWGLGLICTDLDWFRSD